MNSAAALQAFEEFFARHPRTRMLEVLTPDMNGMFRGRRILHSECTRLARDGLRTPLTQSLVTSTGDYRGELDARLAGGEPDRTLLAAPASLAPVPWLSSSTAQVIASLHEADGSPCWADPRHLLQRTVGRLQQAGLYPVVAVELEFYLLAADRPQQPRPLLGPVGATADSQAGDRCAALDDLWEHDAFVAEVHEACDIQGVPITAIQRESSPGQWEINIHHVPDPLLACDQALLLKRIVKGVALRHGIAATFMAKPFTGADGSSMHVHASLCDSAGRNLFGRAHSASPDPGEFAPALRHALGGLLPRLRESMAIFAPNANSYRRFVPGACVPLAASWAYNHRDASLRVPLSSAGNYRLEHRVAGADANPYLVLAVLLAGMLRGIEQRIEPGPMAPQEPARAGESKALPRHWEQALDLFAASDWLPAVLGADYHQAFYVMRSAECAAYQACVSSTDYAWYLRSV